MVDTQGYFFADPTPEQAALARRQAMADALLQQGMSNPGSVPGAGLRNFGSALLGGYLSGHLAQKAKDLETTRESDYTRALGNLLGPSDNSMWDAGAGVDYSGQPANLAVSPRVGATGVQRLAATGNPDLMRQMGPQLAAQLLQPHPMQIDSTGHAFDPWALKPGDTVSPPGLEAPEVVAQKEALKAAPGPPPQPSAGLTDAAQAQEMERIRAQSQAQFENSLAERGYRKTATGYEFIPGGPADPKTIAMMRPGQLISDPTSPSGTRYVGAGGEIGQPGPPNQFSFASGPPGSKPPGITGKAEIDPTLPGYSNAIAGSTGLTQASIDQKALNYITSGTLPPQGRTGIAGIQNAAISNRMAEMDPDGNLAQNKAQLKALSGSLGAQQKNLDSVQASLNVANKTLDALHSWMVQNNVNPSQFPDYNMFVNFLKARGLDPGQAGGYNAQLATLRAEYSNVLARGGQQSDETRRQAAALIPQGLSPSQLEQVAERIQVDGMNAVKERQAQVAQITNQIWHPGGGPRPSTAAPPATLPNSPVAAPKPAQRFRYDANGNRIP